MDKLQKGQALKILANNPVAPQNIDSWAKKSGNELLAVEANRWISLFEKDDPIF